MKKNQERHFLEAIAEGSEAALDALIGNDALTALPVVGTLSKVLKGVNQYRERSFAGKILRFFEQPGLISALERQAHKQKILSSDDQALGEMLFWIIEQVTDTTKPKLLAKLYIAYIDDVITARECRQVFHAVDKAFLDDLLALLPNSNATVENPAYAASLVGTGLTKQWTPGGDYSGITLSGLTPLAAKFVAAVQHANAVQS